MAFMKFYVGNEANASSHRDGIYIAVDTKKIFYNGSVYGGSEVDLSNYYTIAQVDDKIGTNVYTGANYISKETNLTEAVLQLDEEIKATNDNLTLEHENAEATYAKKTELAGYLPLSGGSMTGGINFEGGEFNTEDLPDGLSIVDEQGNIYPNGEGWTQDKGYTGIGISKDGHKFVMAIADNIQNASADDLSINTEKAWSNALYQFNIPDLPNMQIEQAVQDFDSKSNTDAILAALATSSVPNETNNAAVVCRNYSKGVIGKGQWDLPASGILKIIYSFRSRIISLGNQIFGNESWGDLFNLADVWSSNEYDAKRSLRANIRKMGFLSVNKSYSYYVVPVFTGIATKPIITVQGKSDTDVLNANGGTVSIQDIISQVTVPTKVSELTNDSGYQTESQVAAKVSALVDSAPETLNTLNELAAAIGDDPNFATTITTQLGNKVDFSTYNKDKATFALKSDIPNVSNFLTISNAQSTYLTKTDAKNNYQPKGNYLTSVSIATISDLNANWDALLKSAPSGYVTRWPNMSEVGSKQNLVIKLNGGTTEGTNQFTYNVTAAKSINITPSSIGAAASSHNHNASQVSGLSKVATSGSYNDLTNKPTIPSLTGYATQSWVNSQGFAKGSFLPLTGGTISGNLIISNAGDDKNVHINANTGITLKGTGVGISLSTGGSSSKFFATDGSVQTINVADFALKSTTDTLTNITNSQDQRISNMKLGMARYISGSTATVINGDEGMVGLSGTPALYFYNGGISTNNVPIRKCIRIQGGQCYVDNNGIFITLASISTGEIDELFN